MPTPPKPMTKELPPIEDKIQQVFNFLEIANVSQWRGMNVFEAGDHDSLYGILKTALEQALQEGRAEREINNKDILKITAQEIEAIKQKGFQEGRESALREVEAALPKEKETYHPNNQYLEDTALAHNYCLEEVLDALYKLRKGV